MKRVAAWVIFAGVVYAGYVAAQGFKNPWSSAGTAAVSVLPTSPVLGVLPPAGEGCGEKCHD